MVEKTSSFLKHLPQAMDKEQRVFLEILSMATDIISLSYKEIFDVSCSLVARGDQSNFAKPFKFEDIERLIIFRACWSMIDQCNIIRTAISTAKIFDNGKDHDFFEVARNAKKLRDRMDHLGANWKNHSRTKKIEPTLGLLTFCWTKEGDIEILPDGKKTCRYARTVLASGSSLQGEGGVNIIQCNPGNQEWHPVGNFTLYSFNETVSLTELHRCVMQVRDTIELSYETVWNKFVEQQIKAGVLPNTSPTIPIEPLVVVITDEHSQPIIIS